MSLDKLGEKLGVSRQAVWQWEKGTSDPSKNIEGLAKALEKSVEYFYGQVASDVPLAGKISQLAPQQLKIIEMMIDQMLGQDEPEIIPTKKKRVK